MATVDDVKTWLNDPASGSEVYGRNWSGECQAFAWQACNKFGAAPVGYLRAYDAYQASNIVSTDADAAPINSVHYWEIAMPDGHVAIGLGDGMCMMASSKVTDKWATNVGAISLADYTAKVGGHYLGWSNSNGDNSIALNSGTPAPQPKVQLGEDDMAYIRTPQRGFYTATPGVVVSHPDDTVFKGIEYRKWATIMDIADVDLEAYLFAIAGCTKYEIPPVGGVWYGNKAAASTGNGGAVDASGITKIVEAAIQGDYKLVKQ